MRTIDTSARAAMDIQESFKEYSQEMAGTVDDFQIRIGISTGSVETWVRYRREGVPAFQ